MKHTVLYFALLALSFALGGCLAEELLEVQPTIEDEEIPIVGRYVSAHITLSVGDLYISSSTRAEEPSDDPEEDTEAERKVDGIWVFQFDASTRKVVNGSPKYLQITDQATLMDIPTEDTLVDNNGNPCYVYVVANVGSDSWISSMTSDFTLDDLLATTIPNSDPIYSGDDGNPSSSIPMGGQTESSVTVSDHARIIVPVYRMFAKLMVKIHVYVPDDSSIEEAEATSLDIGKVPTICTVGTLYKGNDQAGVYPSETTYMPWSVSLENADTSKYFVIYVPENLQGETDNDIVGNKSADAPANALKVTAHLNLVDTEGAKIKADPQYTVYPGGNVTNNFNVRRNCVYRVKLTISPDDVVSPSANSLIAETGQLIAFYPYVRDEVGHLPDGSGGEAGADYYVFSNHLNSESETLSIHGVKIIWQTHNAIGNNHNLNLVYLYEDGYATKIYVQANEEGNALIAAYNNEDCTGDILWSWHIWITDDHPDDVANAIAYKHYDWDSDGIKYDQPRITGYPVMDRNLGALADEPGDDYTRTYGMLYQWGRKDPIPPMKTDANTGLGKVYGFYGYYDYTSSFTDGDGNAAKSKVDVYDNDNEQIDLGTNTGLRDASYGKGYELFNTYYTSQITPYTQAGGIEYSIKHPTEFIAPVEIKFGDPGGLDGTGAADRYNNPANYYNGGDWLPGSDNDLWGGNSTPTKSLPVYRISEGDDFNATLEDNYGDYKTIFDPCPYGWRVSPGDLWLGFTKNGKNYEIRPYGANKDSTIWENINSTDTSAEVSANKGFHMYMDGWHGEGGTVTSFFPTQGSRLANGQPFHGGICGNYHNATVDELVSVNYSGTEYPDAINRVDILHFHCQQTNQYTQVNVFEKETIYYNRAVAGPVRCVRDIER